MPRAPRHEAASRQPMVADPWLAQYASSHQHPVNQWCHTFGIPMIVVAVPAALLWTWQLGAALWCAGWTLQFVGHAVEGRRPEFFRDWRFLFVGLHWWLAKVRGRL